MKTTKLFFMAALALMTAACSNDDNDFAQQPAEQAANGEITITATVSSDEGATTRALSIDGSNIASTWETTDEFAILFNDGSNNVNRTATVQSINGSNVTITFTIPESLASNTACTIVYPASAANAANTGADVANALATQDGTIENCPEVRVGTATIDKDNHSLSSVTKLAAQNAIFKFTTKNSDGSAPIDVTSLTVTTGGQDYVITPASATSTLFAALPPISSQAVTFTATGSDSKTYTASKASVTFAAGKYYQSNIKMARAPITVTINRSDWGGTNESFTKDGVTVSASMIFPGTGYLKNGSFSTTLGNFTKIVVTAEDTGYHTGWNNGTWEGTPASTVSFDEIFNGVTTIVCTIVPTN